MNNIFYNYIYLDPRKNGIYQYGEYTFEYEPFYVGKGSYNQHTSHLREAKNLFLDDSKLSLKHKILIEMIKFDKVEPIILKVKDNISEIESFKLERLLISLIGRLDKKTGPLVNLTDGGEGTSGWMPSEEFKIKVGERSKGNSYGIGYKHTEHHKKRVSILHKGKMISKETREKISKSHKGKPHTEETKKKMSESFKGRIPWNKGLKNCFSEETRQKMKGKIISDETRQKMKISNTGEKNGFYGKTHTEETKKKMSESLKILRSNSINQPNSKSYKIIFSNDQNLIIQNLSNYCKKNNLNYGIMLSLINNRKKTYHNNKYVERIL